MTGDSISNTTIVIIVFVVLFVIGLFYYVRDFRQMGTETPPPIEQPVTPRH